MGLNLKKNQDQWADWDKLTPDQRDELIKQSPMPSMPNTLDNLQAQGVTNAPGFNLRTAQEQAAPLGDVPASGPGTGITAAPEGAIPYSGIGAGIGMAGQSADPKGMGMGSVVGSTATYAGVGASVGGPYGAVIGGVIGLGLGLMNKQRNTAHANALLAARVGEAKASGLNAVANQEKNMRFRFGGSSNNTPRFE